MPVGLATVGRREARVPVAQAQATWKEKQTLLHEATGGASIHRQGRGRWLPPLAESVYKQG